MRVVSQLLLLALALPCACLEMPITQLSKPDSSVPITDAGDGDDPLQMCRACIAAPDEADAGCKTPYEACLSQPLCKAMIECAFQDQCFLIPRKSFLGCATPCLTKVGVQTGDEAVLGYAYNLFQCFTAGPCGDICFSGP